MNCMKLIEIALVAAALSTAFLQEKGFRGIAPLHSTRQDVEALLGSPKGSRGVASTFDLKDGRVRVFYSSGFCKKGTVNDWKVPPDTVVSLTFEPNKDLMIADLKFDMTKYERVLDDHVQGAVHYFNRSEGIRISTRVLGNEGEDVQTITYEPAARDFHLRCPNSSIPQPDGRQPYLGLKFDEYTNLTFEDERPRLDNLAFHLQKHRSAVGYLIIYSEAGVASGEAKRRAKRAKDYMIKVHGIDPKRIVTIMGGCREKSDVELFATPDFTSPPTPTPVCDK